MENEKNTILDIFTEDIESEMWYMLFNYTYPGMIKKYFDQNNLQLNRIVETKIVTGINQAKEYFEASKTVSLYTSPLLLYYGITNLFYSFSLLKTGEDLIIDNHGMKLEHVTDDSKDIGEVSFTTSNNKKGGFFIFCNNYCQNVEVKNLSWKIKEILSSIPELKKNFENFYKAELPHTMPIESVRGNSYTIEKILMSETERFNDKNEIFNQIVGFKNSYLRPEIYDKAIILKHRIITEDIGVYSLSGQKYFQLAHMKDGKYVSFPIIIYLLMGMFALGMLSRYKPHIWNDYIKSNVTGEKALVERFINYCRRLIPNLFLNDLYKKRINFSNQTSSFIEEKKDYHDEKIKKIVLEELRKSYK